VNQRPDLPVSITSARASRSSDIHKREMRYLLSMAIRTLCFVLAIVTSGPVRWVLVAGAIFLPYVAVVMANASERRVTSGPAAFYAGDRPQVGPGPDAPTSGADQV
jgi:Flp pilus assembly protein TadB